MRYNYYQDMLDNLLTVQELSNKLKLSKTSIFRLIKNHGLPFIKLSGSLRFNESQIESWILTQGKGEGVKTSRPSKSVKKQARIRPGSDKQDHLPEQKPLFDGSGLKTLASPKGNTEFEAVFVEVKGYSSRPTLVFKAVDDGRIIEVEGKHEPSKGKKSPGWIYFENNPKPGSRVKLKGYAIKDGKFRVTVIASL